MKQGFLDRSVVIDGTAHRFQVYVPAGEPPAGHWPVILFLHGSGESGTDGVRPAQVGLGPALRQHPQRYPAIVVFPQCPSQRSGNAVFARIALAALDQTLGEFNTDPARIYLTGLSMGGCAAWHLASLHPERFAALAVVCGWIADADKGLAQRLAHLPVWITHGDADKVVPVKASRHAFAALQAAGADVRYTELPGVDHNAWDPAYQSEPLPAWLFAQHRS